MIDSWRRRLPLLPLLPLLLLLMIGCSESGLGVLVWLIGGPKVEKTRLSHPF